MVPTSQAGYAFAVQFWTREGKRCRRFFKSKKDATVEFNKLNKVIHKEGADGATMGAQDRTEFQAARQMLIDSGVSVLEAVKAYVREHPPCKEAEPFRAAVEDFLAERESLARSARTVAGLRSYLFRFANEAQIIVCGDVSREKVLRAAFARRLSPQSKINTLAAIRQWCRWAVKPRNGFLRVDPTADIERPAIAAKTPVALRAREANACLAFADTQAAEFRLYVALAALAGLRQSEILGLSRVALDGAAKTGTLAVVGIGKRGMSRREVPIGMRLRDVICASPGVLPRMRQKIWSAMKVVSGAARIWCPDILRHTWISHRLALTGDAARTAMEAGNDRGTMSAFYVDPRTPEEARELFGE